MDNLHQLDADQNGTSESLDKTSQLQYLPCTRFAGQQVVQRTAARPQTKTCGLGCKSRSHGVHIGSSVYKNAVVYAVLIACIDEADSVARGEGPTAPTPKADAWLAVTRCTSMPVTDTVLASPVNVHVWGMPHLQQRLPQEQTPWLVLGRCTLAAAALSAAWLTLQHLPFDYTDGTTTGTAEKPVHLPSPMCSRMSLT